MTEAERIATLEAEMSGQLKLADKWDSMLKQVTEINVNLGHLISQTTEFVRNFGSTQTAHGDRLNHVENAIKKLTELSESIPKHETRLDSIDKHIARGSTIWWLIVKVAVAVGALAGFAASAVGVMAWFRP